MGGFLLSQLAGSIRDVTGTYNLAYILSTGMLLIAAILMSLLKSPQRNNVPFIPVKSNTAVSNPLK
jgi:nitrate/nitrite transporter NarK